MADRRSGVDRGADLLREQHGGTDQDIFEVISNGAASKGGSPLMVAWGPVIPEADRWALVKYIRSLKQ